MQFSSTSSKNNTDATLDKKIKNIRKDVNKMKLLLQYIKSNK
jgi:hypothetical protein